MNKALLAYVQENTQKLLQAPSACAEIKAAAKTWLAAVGTDNEDAATAQYIADLESAIMPIDGLIAFSQSELAQNIFGAEGAKGLQAHAQELKANGAAYCDCPACAACKAILDKKAELM